MNYHEIGGVLCRDERGIWGSYNRSKKKTKEQFEVKDSEVSVPLEIFKDRNKSILEAVIVYLVEEYNMKISNIAKLLNKKYSTIYTTYLRSQSKGGQK